jgi:hypothetical protein
MSQSHKDKPAAEPRRKSRRELIDEAIEEAMRPYLRILPPAALATMREILEEANATHPVALEALDALEAGQEVDHSGTRVRGDQDDGEQGGTEGVA